MKSKDVVNWDGGKGLVDRANYCYLLSQYVCYTNMCLIMSSQERKVTILRMEKNSRASKLTWEKTEQAN